MIFHDTAQTYSQPISGVGVRQHSIRRRGWELPGGALLWQKSGKLGLVILFSMLVILLMFNGVRANLSGKVAMQEASLRKQQNLNQALEMEKTALLQPERIKRIAADTMALYESKDQIWVYISDKDRFRNPQ